MLDTEISNEVATRIAEIGRQVAVPRKLTREECTTPELRLEYIAQWLEAGAHSHCGVDVFDMAAVIDKHECGTACCILGATCVWWGKYSEYGSETEAADLLGLHVADGAFEPCTMNSMFYALGTGVCLGEITPPWAARCIRKYQREGVVDWEGTRDA